MEVDSLLQLETAISDALIPSTTNLLQVQSHIRDLFDDALEQNEKDVTMSNTSNAKDAGKLSGFSEHPKVKKMFDEFTGADNDDFIHMIIEDYSTKGQETAGNPGGLVLTKFNGERATRRFIATALKLEGENAERWISQNFRNSWNHFDVNKSGFIEENMLPSYFRSLLGDYTAQFNLREEDHFLNSLRNHA